MNKVALVTGASRGIGFETVRQLAQKGYTVLLGARDPKASAEKLKNEGLDVRPLMLNPTDSASVAAAAAEVEKTFGALDVLVNNAGNFVPEDVRPASQVAITTFRDIYEINVFGLHQVTLAFWPLLNRSEAARLVNVSSALGSHTLHLNGSFANFKAIAYDSSKSAVNMMTIHYAHEWEGSPHKANAVHPGSVKTEINPEGDLTVEEGARTSVALATIGPDGPNGGFFHMGETLPW